MDIEMGTHIVRVTTGYSPSRKLVLLSMLSANEPGPQDHEYKLEGNYLLPLPVAKALLVDLYRLIQEQEENTGPKSDP